jgi:hypothetical protein
MDTGLEGSAGQATSTQPSASTTAASSAGAEMVEKKRLDGALQKIEELTLVNRTLNEQLTALKGEKVTLMAEYGQKESAWTAQQSEFTTKLTSAEQERTRLAAELEASKALKLKMKIVQELNAPALYNVLDVVPDSTDEAVLRPALQKLAQFAGTIAQTREQELLTGVTNVEKAPENNAQLPNSDEAWQSYINGFKFGSPEYTSAMDAWHKWLFKPS